LFLVRSAREEYCAGAADIAGPGAELFGRDEYVGGAAPLGDEEEPW
jgi:hypothetical protein